MRSAARMIAAAVPDIGHGRLPGYDMAVWREELYHCPTYDARTRNRHQVLRA